MHTGEVLAPIDQRHARLCTRSMAFLISALLVSACTSGRSSHTSAAQPTPAAGSARATSTVTANATQRPVVAGYISSSNACAIDSVNAAYRGQQLAEISPVLYTTDMAGTVTLAAHPGSIIDEARAMRLSIIPTLQNLRGGTWDGAMIGALVNDERRRSHHIRQIVDLLIRNDWNGIDIDYENLRPSDSSAYAHFLRLLSVALHRNHKLLTVAVPAKTTDRGDDPASQAYHYDEVAAVADEVRVMAYDHSWETSPPGPVAPTKWVRHVVEYARRLVPSDKLMLGIAAYGYDWVKDRGTPLSATAAANLAAKHHAEMHWDGVSESTWFRYVSAGKNHTVWFENAGAMISKVRLARTAGIRGVVIWDLGNGDPAFWNFNLHD